MEPRTMILVALGVLLAPLMGARPKIGLTLEPLYKYEGDVSDAFLDPSGERVYMVSGSEDKLRIVDWRRKVTLDEVDFSKRIPASERPDTSPVIGWVEIINGSDWAWVDLGDSIYRANWHTWQLVERLGDVGVDVSKSGEWAVVVRSRQKGAGFEASLIATKEWKQVSSWIIPAAGNARLGGQFVAGDRELAVAIFTNEICRIDFYSIPSGRFSRSVDFHERGDSCPDSASFFHPTEPALLISENYLDRSIEFWDTNTGKLVRRITEPLRLENVAISPNGKWIFGSVRERNPAIQRDFKIWDAETGTLLYESPRYLSFSAFRKGFDRPYGHFSSDSQYLLVGKGGELVMYRLKTD